MSTPYVGQIQMFPYAFAPEGYALCQGQPVYVIQYSALFAIIGDRYGKQSAGTFNLPDLRGRVPLQFDSTYDEGSIGGEETHVLSHTEMPQHSHDLMTDQNPQWNPDGNDATPSPYVILGQSSGVDVNSGQTFDVWIYGSEPTTGALDANALSPAGGGMAHENRMPYLTINYSIALSGLWPQPSRNSSSQREIWSQSKRKK